VIRVTQVLLNLKINHRRRPTPQILSHGEKAVVSPNRSNPLQRLQRTQELPLCFYRFGEIALN
jgi:hypothetical protein